MSKKLKYIMSADITKDDLYGEKLPNKQQILTYLTKFKADTKSGPHPTPGAPSPMRARALWTENPVLCNLTSAKPTKHAPHSVTPGQILPSGSTTTPACTKHGLSGHKLETGSTSCYSSKSGLTTLY